MKAADLTTFAAGNIIEDAVFFNKGAMTEAQIQSFLQSKVPTCQSGYTCLKDWYDTSRSTSADAMCGAYAGGVRERASRIIYKVAQACGINPQVFLVMLQKEQGLVTHTWPSAWRYTIAMGQGCPDTAACDTRYYGFFNQVFGAAWQLKRYANPVGTSAFFTWYAPGKTWNVRYHPNTSCGSKATFIQNQATANLYYYTPYQPNAAALRAGYSEGDACSSYGNRNFYNYFTDWFGSTKYNLRAAVHKEWERLGGAAGPLGTPVGGEKRVTANGSGYVQGFQRGSIWWQDGAALAYGITAPLSTAYASSGGPAGTWGWPAGSSRCGLIDDGCLLLAQHGTIAFSPGTGPVLLPATIAVEWNRAGAVAVGYPLRDARCGLVDGGCLVTFQRGTIAHSPATGARAISPAVAAVWNRVGAVALGYPTALGVSIPQNGGGSAQDFTRGSVWASQSGGFHLGLGPFRSNYIAAGGPASPWGWPIGEVRCGLVDGGCLMPFQQGTAGYSPATGSVLIPPAVAAVWNRLGAISLGFPKTPAVLNGTGAAQDFTRGMIVASTRAGVGITSGPFLDAYRGGGGPLGVWGWPLGQPRCGMINAGCLLVAERGTIAFAPATGMWLTPPPIAAEWNRVGAVSIGYPVSAAATTGSTTTQVFERGTVVFDAATGRTAVR